MKGCEWGDFGSGYSTIETLFKIIVVLCQYFQSLIQ